MGSGDSLFTLIGVPTGVAGSSTCILGVVADYEAHMQDAATLVMQAESSLGAAIPGERLDLEGGLGKRRVIGLSPPSQSSPGGVARKMGCPMSKFARRKNE